MILQRAGAPDSCSPQWQLEAVTSRESLLKPRAELCSPPLLLPSAHLSLSRDGERTAGGVIHLLSSCLSLPIHASQQGLDTERNEFQRYSCEVTCWFLACFWSHLSIQINVKSHLTQGSNLSWQIIIINVICLSWAAWCDGKWRRREIVLFSCQRRPLGLRITVHQWCVVKGLTDKWRN